jgi:hypothetical protein
MPWRRVYILSQSELPFTNYTAILRISCPLVQGGRGCAPVNSSFFGGQNGRAHVTIALLLPLLRRRPLTKYEMATSADSMIDEIECYHTTLCVLPSPYHYRQNQQFTRIAINNLQPDLLYCRGSYSIVFVCVCVCVCVAVCI